MCVFLTKLQCCIRNSFGHSQNAPQNVRKKSLSSKHVILNLGNKFARYLGVEMCGVRKFNMGNFDEKRTFSLLTRALEWGPELRAMEGGQSLPPPPVNSAPMKARITKFLWKMVWSKFSKTCTFGDPRSISSRSKNSN